MMRQPADVRGPVSTPDQIRELPDVHVVDQTGDRVMLLEVDPKVLKRHRRFLRGWKVSPEVVYTAPWDEDAPFI